MGKYMGRVKGSRDLVGLICVYLLCLLREVCDTFYRRINVVYTCLDLGKLYIYIGVMSGFRADLID